MTTWREETPQEVQDDLDLLLGRALDVAEQHLNEHGEFHPFAVMIGADGQLGLGMAGDPALGEIPPAEPQLADLREGMRQNSEHFRAVAFVADVRVAGHDAVRVEAEHRDGGPAIACLTSYTRKGFRKKTVTYGPVGAMPGTRYVWP